MLMAGACTGRVSANCSATLKWRSKAAEQRRQRQRQRWASRSERDCDRRVKMACEALIKHMGSRRSPQEPAPLTSGRLQQMDAPMDVPMANQRCTEVAAGTSPGFRVAAEQACIGALACLGVVSPRSLFTRPRSLIHSHRRATDCACASPCAWQRRAAPLSWPAGAVASHRSLAESQPRPHPTWRLRRWVVVEVCRRLPPLPPPRRTPNRVCSVAAPPRPRRGELVHR